MRIESEPRINKKRLGKKAALIAGATLMASGIAGGAYAHENPDKVSEELTNIFGRPTTIKIEGMYFGLNDKINKLKFEVFGENNKSPFEEKHEAVVWTESLDQMEIDQVNLGRYAELIPPPKPSPLILPEVKLLRSDTNPGEGVWTTEGLPQADDGILMERTFLRPDPSRDATVGILLVDKRRIRLNIVGGTNDPGAGPGIIPAGDRPNLLAAWNGGFQGKHGAWGMYANGKEYKPLRNEYASVVAMQDGTIKMGLWGHGELTNKTPDMVAVRQNAALLVDNCLVSNRTNEGNATWGYTSDTDLVSFITPRSAIGLTQNGDLLVAAGTNLSAATLAKALQAAGACTAMQLDINPPWVITSLFFPQPDGTIRAEKFMPQKMSPDPAQFLKPRERDFMYLTLDETNYKPPSSPIFAR